MAVLEMTTLYWWLTPAGLILSILGTLGMWYGRLDAFIHVEPEIAGSDGGAYVISDRVSFYFLDLLIAIFFSSPQRHKV